MKRFKIFSQTYPHSLNNYGSRFKIIAGLVNFKGQELVKQLLIQSFEIINPKQLITAPA